MKPSYYILIAAFFIITGCKKASKLFEEVTVLPTTDTVSKPNYDGYDGDRQVEDTRIIYPSFEVVFHGFAGYDVDRKNGVLYGNPEDVGLRLAGNSLEEALIAKKDTVTLEEFPGYYLNNALMQIIPNNKDDKFKVSMRYRASLREVFNTPELSQEKYEEAYKNADNFQEITPETWLTDSLNYFRTVPHAPDMVKVYATGEIPKEKQITESQFEAESKYMEKDLERIKSKYGIRDTMVVIKDDGDYGDWTVSLGKKGKLFVYDYDSYIIKIERYSNGRLAETKYIEIVISYGC